VSIKSRITLFFALMMLVIEALVLTFIMIINGNVVTNDPEHRLVQVMESNLNRVTFTDQEFQFDRVRYYTKGVYSVLYDEEQTVVRGALPAEFTAKEPLRDHSLRLVQCGEQDFYVYDMHLDMFVGGVWLRGVIDAEPTGGSFMTTIIAVAWSVLPVLLILSILGGYLIAGQALKPIKAVTEAANAISDGQDLKARIGATGGRDEVSQLAASFDNMFDRLEASFEAEQQFTSDASHELRTPTTVILAECNYAQKNAKTPEDYQASLDVIQRQAEKMSTLVKSLLEITRLDQGTQKVNLEYADLSDLVHVVCEEQAIVARSGIRLQTDIQPELYAEIDVFLISRMLQNLIDNAFKFGKENGYVRVTLHRAGAGARLTVEDNGIGISEEDRSRIFQRFYQAEDSRRSQGGMGLGLSMVRQIVQLHGGTITVDSTEGRGTTFTVTLPEHPGKEEMK
jgi:signal transduction histidine kinase